MRLRGLCSDLYHHQAWAFESREFLRTLTVGKEITFATIHSLPSNDDAPRDLGSAELAGVDLSSELLRNGWAKLKEIKREPSEEDLKKRELEAEAKAAGRGIWNPHGQTVRPSTRTPKLHCLNFDS
jgi:staphylococcal nuclease domain-containing protein 1